VRLILLLVAVVCLGVGLLLELGAFGGGDVRAWTLGGLLAFVASSLPLPER